MGEFSGSFHSPSSFYCTFVGREIGKPYLFISFPTYLVGHGSKTGVPIPLSWGSRLAFVHQRQGVQFWKNTIGRRWAKISLLIWVFPKIGVSMGIPKWMVKIMENPIKMDDLGVPLFLETSILLYNYTCSYVFFAFIHVEDVYVSNCGKLLLIFCIYIYIIYLQLYKYFYVYCMGIIPVLFVPLWFEQYI